MPIKSEREVELPELEVWTKILVRGVRLKVKGEPHGPSEFEAEIVGFKEVVWAGFEDDDPPRQIMRLSLEGDDEPMWDTQDELRSIEGWDDEEEDEEE